MILCVLASLSGLDRPCGIERENEWNSKTNGHPKEVVTVHELLIDSWRKSSRSSGNPQQCVEVGRAGDKFGIRDTKNRDGGVLLVPTPAFDALLSAIRTGRLS